MTGARISFTCDTSDDQDVVAWLDSFASRERGFAIKAAIRYYIEAERGGQTETEVDRLSVLEDKISEIFQEVVQIRKQGLALSINNDIINNDLQSPDKSDNRLSPEVESNLGALLDE